MPTAILPLPGDDANSLVVPVTRFWRWIEPSMSDPTYALRPLIAMPSGKKPSGRSICVGNRTLPVAVAGAALVASRASNNATTPITYRCILPVVIVAVIMVRAIRRTYRAREGRARSCTNMTTE